MNYLLQILKRKCLCHAYYHRKTHASLLRLRDACYSRNIVQMHLLLDKDAPTAVGDTDLIRDIAITACHNRALYEPLGILLEYLPNCIHTHQRLSSILECILQDGYYYDVVCRLWHAGARPSAECIAEFIQCLYWEAVSNLQLLMSLGMNMDIRMQSTGQTLVEHITAIYDDDTCDALHKRLVFTRIIPLLLQGGAEESPIIQRGTTICHTSSTS